MNRNVRRSLPPIIKTSDPGSFAAFTLRERLPAILEQIITKNGLSGNDAQALKELQERVRSGTVQPCLSIHPYLVKHMDGEELATWSREIEGHLDRSWLDLPWYFAESLFYLEVLLAWGYYREASPRYAADPYRPFKEEELTRSGGALELAARIIGEMERISDLEEKLPILLRYALWANRLDLSYSRLHQRYRDNPGGESNQLLLDHSQASVERLLGASRIDLILDNSGSELIADLCLMFSLLQYSRRLTVCLHCKKAPFYVSDATIRDVKSALRSLGGNRRPELRRMAGDLSRYIEGGRLILSEHFFWNGPLCFPGLPPELKNRLGGSDLVVFKGDLNYRRLLADRRWDHRTAMETVVGYFPAALIALRTTKSEIIVDVPAETVKKLSKKDPKWLTEGRYGIIRYCDPRPSSGARNSLIPLS